MIGFYGGTFDPIHLGHIHLAKTLLARYAFSKLFFVPNFQNPLKQKTGARGEDRLELIHAALNELNETRFGVIDWEVKSQQPSYTIDSIRRLSERESEEVVLIVGNEVFQSLPHWKEPQELLKLVSCIIVERQEAQGAMKSSVESTLLELGLTTFKKLPLTQNGMRFTHCGGQRWIEVQNVGALPYSATRLRLELCQMRRKGHNETPPEGLQRSVWLLVKEKHLYAVT